MGLFENKITESEQRKGEREREIAEWQGNEVKRCSEIMMVMYIVNLFLVWALWEKCSSKNTMVIYNVILQHEKLEKSRCYQNRWLGRLNTINICEKCLKGTKTVTKNVFASFLVGIS